MKPQRVPNGALEGPKWSPGGSKMEPGGSKMEADGPRWGPARGPMPPQRALERLKCRFELAKPTPRCVPGSPGPARARFCVRFWAPEGAPRGPKSDQKVDQKCFQKQLCFRSRFGVQFYRFWVPKSVFLGPENGTKCIYRLQGAYAKCIGKTY